MQLLKAALGAALLLSVALAGCSGGAGAAGIKVSGPNGDGQYTFTATGGGDNFTWDLGDHLTRAYGKKVTHTYDFDSGVVPVVLTVKTGESTKEYRKEITLGSGTNEEASFVLEGSTNWTVLGEAVTFSAARSTDPEGDPLRYTWSCQRVSDAVRQSPHVHSGFGGKPFATPPAGTVLAINALGPLPAPDRTVTGDLCDSLGPGGRPSLDATIQGSFSKSGVYDIYLLASDPVHPTTSGKYRIVATPEAERPPEILTIPFQGTFTAGGGDGTLYTVCSTAQQCTQTYDYAEHSFSLSLLGQAGYVTLDYDDPSGLTNVTWVLKRGDSDVAAGNGAGSNVTLNPTNLKAASYKLEVRVGTGAPVTPPNGLTYDIKVVVDLDLDPFKVY